jgi:hypothetical protein
LDDGGKEILADTLVSQSYTFAGFFTEDLLEEVLFSQNPLYHVIIGIGIDA